MSSYDDDYGSYNGDTVHDMWVDDFYETCTGENVTGNEHVPGRDNETYHADTTHISRESLSDRINSIDSSIAGLHACCDLYKRRLANMHKRLSKPDLDVKSINRLKEYISQNTAYLKDAQNKIKSIEQEKETLIAERTKQRKHIFITVSVFVIVALALFLNV